MNIEKTIEEKALTDGKKYGYDYDSQQMVANAYKRGYQDALSLNRWRKVSEELPELWQMVLFKVHVYAENYQSESLTVGHLDTGGYHLQLNDEDIFKIEVEEWKPII